jgi:hypothetical protein
VSNSDSPHISTPKGVVFKAKIALLRLLASIHNTSSLNQGSVFSLRKFQIRIPRMFLEKTILKKFSRGWPPYDVVAPEVIGGGVFMDWTLSKNIKGPFHSKKRCEKLYIQKVHEK